MRRGGLPQAVWLRDGVEPHADDALELLGEGLELGPLRLEEAKVHLALQTLDAHLVRGGVRARVRAGVRARVRARVSVWG